MMPTPEWNVMLTALGWTLLHFLWQGTAVAAATALAVEAIGRRRAERRYAIACLGLLAMAAVPVLTFLWLVATPAAPTKVAESAALPSPLGAASTPDSDSIESLVLTGVVAVWAVGAAIFLLRLLGGWVQVHRLRRLPSQPLPERLRPRAQRLAERFGVRVSIRVVETARVVTPMAVGFLRPVILVPIAALSELTPAQVEAILAHELAHVRRADYLVNLLQALVEALLFYHPAVWWLNATVRAEREHCCDDAAVAACGSARAYAQTLVELEALRGASVRLGLSSQGGPLMRRVERILGVGPAPAGRPGRHAAVAAVAIAATGTAAYAVKQAPEPEFSVRAPQTFEEQPAAISIIDGQLIELTGEFQFTADPFVIESEATPNSIVEGAIALDEGSHRLTLRPTVRVAREPSPVPANGHEWLAELWTDPMAGIVHWPLFRMLHADDHSIIVGDEILIAVNAVLEGEHRVDDGILLMVDELIFEPAIVDQWGQPVHFHLQGEDEATFEIRFEPAEPAQP